MLKGGWCFLFITEERKAAIDAIQAQIDSLGGGVFVVWFFVDRRKNNIKIGAR